MDILYTRWSDAPKRTPRMAGRGEGGCTGLLQPLCPDAPPSTARAAFSLQSPKKVRERKKCQYLKMERGFCKWQYFGSVASGKKVL